MAATLGQCEANIGTERTPTNPMGVQRCPKDATQEREGELLCDEHAAQWDEEDEEEWGL